MIKGYWGSKPVVDDNRWDGQLNVKGSDYASTGTRLSVTSIQDHEFDEEHKRDVYDSRPQDNNRQYLTQETIINHRKEKDELMKLEGGELAETYQFKLTHLLAG